METLATNPSGLCSDSWQITTTYQTTHCGLTAIEELARSAPREYSSTTSARTSAILYNHSCLDIEFISPTLRSVYGRLHARIQADLQQLYPRILRSWNKTSRHNHASLWLQRPEAQLSSFLATRHRWRHKQQRLLCPLCRLRQVSNTARERLPSYLARRQWQGQWDDQRY